MEDQAACLEACFHGDPNAPDAADVNPNHDWMNLSMPNKFAYVHDLVLNFQG